MSYRLEIPEPCGEDWSLMTPQEKGRHCAVCDKVVVDFSKATKREIIAHIKKEGKICGRVPQAFININLVDESERQAFGIKGLVATVVNLLALTTTVQAQVKEEPKQEVSSKVSENGNTNNVFSGDTVIQRELVVLRGKVVSNTNDMPIFGATVFLKGSDYVVSTDLEGQFKLTIPINEKKDDTEMIVLYNGFVDQKIRIDNSVNFPMVIKLMEIHKMLEGVLVGSITITKKKRFWLF